MKKNVSILLIAITLSILAFFALTFFGKDLVTLFTKEAKYDFRNTNWGMSKEQVKATEYRPGYEDDTIFGQVIAYNVEIGNKDYICAYYFYNNKLYQSAYSLTTKHVNRNLYIADYKELKEILTKEYGKPMEDLYSDEEEDEAIGIRDLQTVWKTSTTEIGLRLANNERGISLTVGYDSKKLKGLMWKALEEKSKNSF